MFAFLPLDIFRPAPGLSRTFTIMHIAHESLIAALE